MSKHGVQSTMTDEQRRALAADLNGAVKDARRVLDELRREQADLTASLVLQREKFDTMVDRIEESLKVRLRERADELTGPLFKHLEGLLSAPNGQKLGDRVIKAVGRNAARIAEAVAEREAQRWGSLLIDAIQQVMQDTVTPECVNSVLDALNVAIGHKHVKPDAIRVALLKAGHLPIDHRAKDSIRVMSADEMKRRRASGEISASALIIDI